MRTVLASTIAGVAIIGGAVACGPSNHHVTAKASSLATSSTAANARADVQKLVKGCVPASQASLATHQARVAFETCLKVPPAKKTSFENCVIGVVEHDLGTHAGRLNAVNNAFPNCVIANR